MNHVEDDWFVNRKDMNVNTLVSSIAIVTLIAPWKRKYTSANDVDDDDDNDNDGEEDDKAEKEWPRTFHIRALSDDDDDDDDDNGGHDDDEEEEYDNAEKKSSRGLFTFGRWTPPDKQGRTNTMMMMMIMMMMMAAMMVILCLQSNIIMHSITSYS